MFTELTIRPAIGFAVLFSAAGSQAQELNEVALAFLQRRGVPCLNVTAVDRPIRDFDMIATCNDGREWALFFVEGEVAYVQPATGEPYRWRQEVYRAYPELYGEAEIRTQRPMMPVSEPLHAPSAEPPMTP